jgi:hypothetical protein
MGPSIISTLLVARRGVKKKDLSLYPLAPKHVASHTGIRRGRLLGCPVPAGPVRPARGPTCLEIVGHLNSQTWNAPKRRQPGSPRVSLLTKYPRGSASEQVPGRPVSTGETVRRQARPPGGILGPWLPGSLPTKTPSGESSASPAGSPTESLATPTRRRASAPTPLDAGRLSQAGTDWCGPGPAHGRTGPGSCEVCST